MRYLVILLFVILVGLHGEAQDAHFSQWHTGASANNPALLGNTSKQFLIGAQYRTQWAAISSPYRTYRVFFEYNPGYFAWGGHITQNNAGPSSLKQGGFYLSGTYHKILSKDAQIVLSVGITAGIAQHRFNPSAFTFDNQYTPEGGFDINNPTNENFEKTNILSGDVGIGLNFQTPISSQKENKLQIGFSIEHLPRPIISHYNDDDIVLPMKINIHMGIQWQVQQNLFLNPYLVLMHQTPANELLSGIDVSFNLNKKTALIFGVASRMGDSWIVKGGINYKNIKFECSYDFNASSLSQTTGGVGAFEIGATLHFDNRNSVNIEEPQDAVTRKDDDTDGDEIPDVFDECPLIPGLAKYKGCLDSDKDGIWDNTDACPHLAGEKENQGCPLNTKDYDHDGIADELDSCPFIIGIIEFDGCPDTDKDGISDIEDHCPFLKGYKTNDGCPKMAANAEQGNFPYQLRPTVVEFDTDQSYIKPEFYPILDQAINTLFQNAEAKAMISGHTYAEGSELYNYQLGRQRANSVMEYILKNGISAKRIQVFSYGETKPIHTNKNNYGKVQNRRAEVTIIY